MSVVWIAGQRFAAGLEWQRGHVSGRDARRLARQRRRPWAVDVAGQTGFAEDAEEPGGAKPLAGALLAFVRMQAEGFENWIAFIREDIDEAGEAGKGRVAVVRRHSGSLLADGESVFVSPESAVEALGAAALKDMAVIASPELLSFFPDAIGTPSLALRNAAGDVAILAPVQTGSVSRKTVVRAGAAALLVAIGTSLWTYRVDIGVRFGWFEEKKKEERPKVRVTVETDRFLGFCRDELARRELWMAGFERVAVYCHSSYEPEAGVSPPKELGLKGRAVLEVRWQLREPLSPRVYGRLAEQLLERWFWAGVNDNGQAAAINPLPPVLALARKGKREDVAAFRARVDGMFPLRGFAVEYRWDKRNEVTLLTARPFAQSVSMIGGVKGIEIVSAIYEKGVWRFEGRRVRPRSMFKDRFLKLSKPLASGGLAGRKAA